jgi:hypothetical protein
MHMDATNFRLRHDGAQSSCSSTLCGMGNPPSSALSAHLMPSVMQHTAYSPDFSKIREHRNT